MPETQTAENEPDRWSDFETEDGPCGQESERGDMVWGAYCPQPECGELNLFEGDPAMFAKRPYRCVECNWVSLMDESVAEIKGSLYASNSERGSE